jgi:NarL family two-component system response regulator YdfI
MHNSLTDLFDTFTERITGIFIRQSKTIHLRREHPKIAIVILTTHNEDGLMIRGLQAGARGYLLKDMNRENLLDTIHAAKGETLLKPEILARVPAAHTAPRPESLSRTDSSLTERELEVLQAAARGERNKEIAYKLGITERTVKAHLASIYRKFSVDSRAAAVAVAAQKGLFDRKIMLVYDDQIRITRTETCSLIPFNSRLRDSK